MAVTLPVDHGRKPTVIERFNIHEHRKLGPSGENPHIHEPVDFLYDGVLVNNIVRHE